MTTIFIYLFIYFYHFLNFILKIKFENFGATFHHEFFSTHIENDWGSSINGLLEKTFNLVFVFFLLWIGFIFDKYFSKIILKIKIILIFNFLN